MIGNNLHAKIWLTPILIANYPPDPANTACNLFGFVF
jgi:hypothetical protein